MREEEMSKAVLISIRPKWCALSASGEKTVEVRKTMPNIKTPFKCYIYCTSVKSMKLTDYVHIHAKTNGMVDEWNGKVIGEFICNDIYQYTLCGVTFSKSQYVRMDKQWYAHPIDYGEMCLTPEEFAKYADGRRVYGWHISDLVIYDTPKELSEFHYCGACEYGIFCNDDTSCKKKLQRPPQSWCYVEEL
jgi:predicted transcriptional regulator